MDAACSPEMFVATYKITVSQPGLQSEQ